ncbi:hypothetical protein [Streptomyces sp. x-80]|uniref:hypothetical protein n=1 Tax=Streptomyces sp. x-80 TaxID=2789282 RepID=UPI0039806233
MTLGPPLEAACTTTKRVLLAAPKGFCAGVIRAIAAVEKARELHSPPIYVRHEIVHNKYVVKTLEKKGAIFVDETFEVPEGNIVMFSAHGVSPTVHDEAAERKLATIDATCPLVTKVHKEAVRFASEDYDILLIGHEGHAEVIGTSGEAPDHITLVDGPCDVGHVEVRDPATPPGRFRQPRADRQAGPGRPTGGQARRPARPLLSRTPSRATAPSCTPCSTIPTSMRTGPPTSETSTASPVHATRSSSSSGPAARRPSTLLPKHVSRRPRPGPCAASLTPPPHEPPEPAPCL